jgi:uncharacterized protein YjdB
MKKLYFALIVFSLLCLAGSAFSQSTTFSTPGYYTYTVPTGATTVNIDLGGAQGGTNVNGNAGGKGGRLTAVLNVTGGQVLNIYVGGRGGNANYNPPGPTGGYNGGANGSAYGGAGGGASDIRVGGTALSNRVAVAGGGGGFGDDCGYNDNGGDGGGSSGNNGYDCGSYNSYYAGAGGSQVSGGSGAVYGGYAGTLGNGGRAPYGGYSGYFGYYYYYYNGGGGGGGYYGGGGGYYGGGGGGSSYPLSGATTAFVSSVTNSAGYQSGDGYVTICAPNVGTISGGLTAICQGTTTTYTTSGSGGSWVSSNPAVASVTGGVVTGVSAGVVNISYVVTSLSCGGGYAIKTLTVNPVPTALVGPTAVCVGSTITLTSTPSGGTWSSTNTAVATVAGGVVTGVSAGTTTISYLLPTGCNPATAVITVNPQPLNITGPTSVCGSLTITLTDGTPGGTWSSSNTVLATVGSLTGVVTGVVAGTPTITYTLPTGCLKTTPITVNPLSAITGVPSTCIGGTTLLADATPGGTWSSSNPAVATISVGGLVSAVSVGTTTVSYVMPVTGCTATQVVTVVNTPTPFAITGGGSYCFGGTGVNVGLATTNAGVSYQLYNFSTPVGAPVTGGGFAITFGLQTLAGPYTVVAMPGTTCAVTMTGTANVVINPLPTAFTVSGGGAYCAGGAGVHIFLNSSQIGTNYQLFNGLVPVGSPIAGTSAALDFGFITGVGTYSVVGTTTATGCVNTMSGTVNVSTNPLPTSFVVSSGGGYCSGGAGVAITLSGSTVGVNYQLFFGPSPVGAPLAGTGGVLNFGLFTTAGTYTVVATNATTLCTANMTGSAVITINPLPTVFNVIGGGSYCSGGTGVSVGLNGSTIGVNYQLYRGVTAVGSPIPGTGVALDFGLQTVAGSYTVVATNGTTACTSNMLGSVNIVINPLPLLFTVTGGGSYCSGGAGRNVGLSGSNVGITYQLFNGATLVGAASGTGSTIDFGLFTASGTYTVLAINATTLCSTTMTGSVTISINPLPTVFTVTGGGAYCAGGTGRLVGLSGSTLGVNYQLFVGGIATGAPVPGTGSAISFGLQTTVGSYTVVATNATTTCTNNMTGSVAVSTNPLPTAYAMTGGGPYCVGGAGVHIGLGASNIGISYALFNGVTLVNTVLGTGAAIDFGIVTAAGTYTVVGTNTTTLCTNNMAGSLTVVINPVPTAYNVSAGGNYCVGGAGFDITLSNSTSGVNYQLYNGGTPVGTPMAGTGALLDFGFRPVGSYTIVGTNATTGCTTTMTGTAVIGTNPLPTPYVITGGGSYCAGGAGVTIGLTASTVGISYQLYNGVALVGAPIPGTGGALTFPPAFGAGTYTIVGTNTTTLCANTMTGSVTVTINPLPGLFTITGGGNYCTGGSGVHIGLSGSAIGVNYQLYYGVTAVGAPMAGTGSALDFGLLTGAGSYTVVATNTTTGCTNTMTGTATIVVTALPILHTVTGGGGYCPSGTGVHVGLNGSDIAINYQLYNGALPVGSPVPGTGAAIDFGVFTAPGTYTVVASNGTTACTGPMTGSAVIFIYTLPTLYNVTGTGNYCPGGTGVHVGLSGSSTGVTYQLYNGPLAIGTPLTGTGLPLDFGLHTAGSYTVYATSTTTGCTNLMNGTALIGISPLPASHNVTGGGNYCSGGIGSHIGLDGSDPGTWYQLYRGVVAVGSPMAGTSLALDFGLQTVPGTYTVLATSTTTTCSNTMTGSAIIGINPLPATYTVTGGGNYCSGGAGVHVMLSGSDVGTNYQLFNGPSMVGSPLPGTGLALDFGAQTAAGTYMVVATNTSTVCSNNMTGSVTITIDPLPTAFTVTGGGDYCAGGTGVHVMIIGSVVGTTYQLMNGLTAVGAPMAGTGFGLDFGLQTAPGVYTVVGTNLATGCSGNMSGSVVVSTNPLPTVYTVTGLGSVYCAGGMGIDITLSGSDLGASYQLYNGLSTVGGPVAGTGLPIDFGYMTDAGTYTVVGINTTTSCTNNMFGSATITINPAPAAFTVTGGGQYCTGGTGVMVGLSGSNAGVLYQLYNGLLPVGTPIAGTGTPLNFGLQTAAGVYTVMATNPATTCTRTMTGSTSVVVNPLPAAYTVTGGGNYCSGGTGVHVGLSGSVFGVNYQLRRGVANVGGPVAGNGSALDFGLQTLPGTYTVVATTVSTTCTNTMTGSVTIGINPLPNVYSVTGGGNYCPGGLGVHVGLSGSNTGVNYQLYRGLSAVGTPLAGSGAGLDFGLQTTAGTYTVVAIDATTSCTNNMAGGVNVVLNTTPAAFTVIGGGGFCAGGSGVHVGLNGSEAGISYQLYDGFTAAGAPVIGTGGPIDLGLQTTPGTYSVIGTNNSTTCSNNMTGTVLVVVNPMVVPSVSVSSGGGDTICSGHVTTFTALTVNGGVAPTFQWTVNGTLAGSGSTYSYLPANGDVVGVTMTSSAACATPTVASNTMGIVVNAEQIPAVSVSTNPGNLVCQGTMVDFTASPSNGGTAPSYSWLVNGVNSGSSATFSYTPLNNDNIYVVMTSNYRCRLANTATSSHVVMQVDAPVLPVVDITVNPTGNIAQGQTVTLTATVTNGGPTPSYQWLINGIAVPGATLPSFTSSSFANMDSVTCQVLSSGGCPGLLGFKSKTIHVYGVGVKQIVTAGSDIQLIPNPNKGIFTVKGTLNTSADEEVSLEVTNMLGQVIYTNKVMAKNGEINEKIQLNKNIANGMYILNFRSESDNKVFHIVVEQ